MANTNDLRRKNTKFGGTEGIVTPRGQTSERGGMPELGTMRYNTELGFMEQYNATGWAGIDAPPTVSNISGTILSATDSTITISGSNFKTGSTISITGAAVGGLDRPLSTTYVNSSELTANTNASSVNFIAGASFNVKVTNPSGLSAVLEPAGTIDTPPSFNTPAGTVASIIDEYQASYGEIATISATDPDGGSTTYAETTGNLAARGLSLNSTTGVINGNPSNNAGGQDTLNFTVEATNSGAVTSRNFSIIINPAPDGSSANRPGKSAATIKQLTGTTTNGNYWIQHSSLNSGNAFQIYADMNKSEGQQWFSPGYFGIEPSSVMRCTNNATYTKIKYRRVNSGSYYWWFLISSIDGSNNCVPVYGALIQTPSGGSTGDDLEANLTSDPVTTFGNPTVPSSGNYYISWMSTAPGYTAPSGNIWTDMTSGGQCGYVQTSTAPTTSTTYTLTATNTGHRIHINAQAVYNGEFISTGHPSWRGGWTLVLSHIGGDGVDWRDSNLGLRNQTSPTLNGGGYSILSWAPTIRTTDTRWEYMHAGNNSTDYLQYGGIIKAGSGDNFLDSTPRNGTYTRQETLSGGTYGAAGGSDSTMYDRPLWTNYGSYSPYPSALLSSFPGTPNWWGTVVEGGYPRGYTTGPYMSTAGMGSPQYQWVWVK